MVTPFITELIGIIGMSLLLIAFTLNLMRKITPDSDFYLVLNIIASILLLIYAALLQSIPFVILNVVWGSASLLQLFREAFPVQSKK